MYVIDFETRSTVNVKDVGSFAYASHPATEPICLAFARADNDDEPSLWTFTQSPDEAARVLAPLFESIGEGDFVEAHNVLFERCLWELVCVPRFGWPAIKPDQWRCTAARCAAAGLPRALDSAAKVLKLPIQKDTKGRRVMLKLSKPRKLTKKEREAQGQLFADFKTPAVHWHERADELATVFEYCRQDVRVERTISQIVPELSAQELEVWKLDQAINLRGLAVDLEGVKAAIDLLETEKEKANQKVRELTGGAVRSLQQNRVLLEWLRAYCDYPYQSLAAQAVEAALRMKRGRTVNDLGREILTLLKSVSQSSTAKYKKFLQRTTADGRTRDLIVYCGATRTGRWAGTGIQPQNFYRGDFNKKIDELVESIKRRDPFELEFVWGSVYGACASAVRAMIVAAPGHRLIVADFAAIEARVLAWLADEKSALEIFAEDLDIYKDFATDLYGVRLDDVTKDQRQIAKICILGLGYQMGPTKFSATVENYGKSITDEFAQTCVDTFRNRFSAYPRFWRRLEAAAIDVVLNGKARAVGRLIFRKHGATLRCRLPSGRELVYLRPRVVEQTTSWGEQRPKLEYEGQGLNKQWGLEATYGGKIAENVTQAVSRDLMASAMLALESRGYSNVLTVHDEAVLEVPDGFGSLDEVLEIMKTPPPWANGCPIGAAGFESLRYRKD